MARFLAGLNREIQNVVELQHYVELKGMVHMAIKIENQIKKRSSSNTRSAPSPSSSTWKSNQWRKEERQPTLSPKRNKNNRLLAREIKVNLILPLLRIVILSVLNVKI